MPDPRRIRKKSGASKILESHLCPNCSNMWLPIRLIREAGRRVPGPYQRLPEFRTIGVIMPPDDKDSALLPRRIDGYWALSIVL